MSDEVVEAGRRTCASGRFLKNAPRHFPAWIRTISVPKREGGTIRQVLANDAPTLVYLAGQNAITPISGPAAPTGSNDRTGSSSTSTRRGSASPRSAPRPERWATCCATSACGPFAMTTGSRGLHVVVPLRRTADTQSVHAFARDVGALLAEQHPDTLTIEFRRAKRGERIFIDVNRNGYGQHAVAPYAVRSLGNAPVATPLRWEELDDRRLDPQSWTAKTVRRRIASDGDPWRDIARRAKAPGPARRALGR